MSSTNTLGVGINQQPIALQNTWEPLVWNSPEDVLNKYLGAQLPGGVISSDEYKKYNAVPMSAKPGDTSTTGLRAGQGGMALSMARVDTAEQNLGLAPTSTAAASPTPKTPGAGAIGAMYGAQAVNEMIGGVQQANLAQYNTDVNYWNQQGKWWFDKNADFAPTRSQYIGNMPSAVKATGGAAGTMGLGALKGAATGAATGAMIGGPVGAVIGGGVGALVGLVEGFFTNSAAKHADQQALDNANREYERQLKEWTYAMNSRLTQTRNAMDTSQRLFLAQSGQEAIGRKKEAGITAEHRRQQMIASIMGSGSVQQAERQRRMARWG